MKATTKELIEKRLEELNKPDYPNIFNKMKFKAGDTLICNMVYDQIAANKGWSFENAVARVEYLLNELR